MRQSLLFLFANLLLCVAVSAQASDYKLCHTSFDILNTYKKPIMYTVTFNDTVVSHTTILPHTHGVAPFPYLADKKEACDPPGIPLVFRPSVDCIDSVLDELHQYDTCLIPDSLKAETAYKNVLSQLLNYGLVKRIDFSIVILDSYTPNPLTIRQ